MSFLNIFPQICDLFTLQVSLYQILINFHKKKRKNLLVLSFYISVDFFTNTLSKLHFQLFFFHLLTES